MPARETRKRPPGKGHPSLERWENEGGGSDEHAPEVHADLNALLASEQTAIMSAEAATDEAHRLEQRTIARQVRDLVDLTPFPQRDPHDFDRLPLPALSGSDAFTAEFDALRQHVMDVENTLGLRLSEGTMGQKHNSFEHRSRLLRQARARLAALRP